MSDDQWLRHLAFQKRDAWRESKRLEEARLIQWTIDHEDKPGYFDDSPMLTALERMKAVLRG